MMYPQHLELADGTDAPAAPVSPVNWKSVSIAALHVIVFLFSSRLQESIFLRDANQVWLPIILHDYLMQIVCRCWARCMPWPLL